MVTIYFSVLILIFKGKNRNKIIHIDDLKIFKALQKYMKWKLRVKTVTSIFLSHYLID